MDSGFPTNVTRSGVISSVPWIPAAHGSQMTYKWTSWWESIFKKIHHLFQTLIIYPLLQLRYNFKLQRGEVKIDREYRQCCPAHGGPLVHPIVGAKSGAKWVMERVMRFIRARFYTDRESSSRTGAKKPSSVSSSNSGSGTSLDRIESGPEFEVVRNRRRRRRRLESRPLYRPQPDHNPHNCEACLLRRCPRPSR